MAIQEKLFFIVWSSVSLAIALFLFLLGSVSNEPAYRPIEILPGAGFKEIAGNLESQGLIRSKNTFLIYGALSGSAHQLKPGNYLLSAGSSTPAITLALVEGPAIDKEVLFPEGVTLKDIEAILGRENILTGNSLSRFPIKSFAKQYQFLEGARSLEGFLFPDTYRFFIGSNTEPVARKFLDNFNKGAWSLLKNVKNWQEKLIIASLLEKEAPDYLDRQIITGILYKRLAVGMPLQIDATITYAKCGGAFLTCADPKVYRKDLQFPSPYNTYIYNGLPAGPIGNPGLDAIKAALNPIKSDYLYYLSDPKTKKTIFSKTLEEHIDNRAKYLGA